MKPGITISCVGHVGVLVWGIVAFAAKPMDAPATDALPVDFISAKQFSEMTAGVKNAPKLETPKPLADKIDVPKPIPQLAPTVADKPEIVTNTAAQQPPLPPPKPPEKKKEPEQKIDPIAQELKKEEAKKPPPKPEEKPAPKKPAQQTPKFDASQVAALLDKRAPRRQLAAAETLNNAPSLGTAAGSAAKLSQTEIDALRARINECWNPPAASLNDAKIYVVLRVLFRPDGMIARDPAVVEGTASATGPVLAESAKRAMLGCQPFTMLKPEHFDQWKDMEIKFDPHDKTGG